MAQRSGTRTGADRPGFGEVRRGGPSVRVDTIPVPPAATRGATAWGILSSTLESVSVDAHRRYDRQVQVQAREAGVQDALDGRIRQLDRSTTRGGAYHDAAVSTMETQLETNAIAATTDLYRQHADNPAELQQALDLYGEGVIGEMMRVSPERAVALRQRMLTNAIPMVNGAIENRERKMAAAVKFAREAAESEEQVAVAMHSANIFSADPQQSAASVAGLTAARSRVTALQSEEAAEGVLLSKLSSGHNAAHIVNMQPEMKTRLAALFQSAPPEIAEGLGVLSGFRSIERQTELWEASDKTGRTVARPGSSQHNHGNAVDLAWNGQSLKHAPENVRKWVRENASTVGLKLPMDYEPWHLEIQETRGGPRFEGLAKGSSEQILARDQDFNDRVIGPGLKAWFAEQTDKVEAYRNFVNGEVELPIHLPDGQRIMVDVRSRLSAKAAGEIEGELRERIRFDTTLREQAETRAAKELEERSSRARADFVTGIYAAGETFDLPEGQRVAQRPAPADLRKALDLGLLQPGDYETLLKAATVEQPVRSDEGVKAEAFRLARAGVDPEAFILENLGAGRITAADARAAVGDFASLQEKTSGLNKTQAFYVDQLDATFSQGNALDFDEAKQERRANALIEARERMLAGEDAGAVFRDVLERSKLADRVSLSSAVQSEVRPRFSVADPADPSRVDVAGSFAALERALADKLISESDFNRQLESLDRWDRLQQELDRAAASRPAKAE